MYFRTPNNTFSGSKQLGSHQLDNLRGKKTFFFLFYAGHGILADGTTKAVLNTNIENESLYPLEANLRILGK